MSEITHTIIHIGNTGPVSLSPDSYETAFLHMGKELFQRLGGVLLTNESLRNEALYLLPIAALAQALLDLRPPKEKSFVRVYNLAPQEFQLVKTARGAEMQSALSSYTVAQSAKT